MMLKILAPLLFGTAAIPARARMNQSTPLHPQGPMTAVLPAAEYSHFWKLQSTESELAFQQGQHPLEAYSAAARGSIFKELVRRVDELLHPGSVFNTPLPEWRNVGLRRSPDESASCHWLRDGLCIMSRGATMRWRSEVGFLVARIRRLVAMMRDG